MTTVLVTGGNIGDKVAEELAGKGFAVRVLTKTAKPNSKWEELKIEVVPADMANLQSLIPAFDGIERFFSVTPFVENLVKLGINAVEAAKRSGVRRIVRSSFIGASETGITMGRDHRAVEKAVEASGIPQTILRPNTFMQSYAMNAGSIKSDSAFYMPQGEGKVSLVDVRDIASVAAAVLTEDGHEGKIYEITGGEALSNTDIARELSNALGKDVRYIDVDERQAEQSMTNAGLPGWMVQSLLGLFQFAKAGDAAKVSPAVETILKRAPISFDRFLGENLALFQ